MSTLVEETVRVMREQLPPLLGDGYELRADQLDMAEMIARSLEHDGVSVIEAPTGIGKSLAYLVPCLLHCRRHNVRAVVATYTRTLQRQLARRDLETASRATGGGVEGVVLMGRGSYACRIAIARYLRQRRPARNLAGWLRNVADEPNSDLDSFAGGALYLDDSLRAAVSCPAREAVCRGCAERERCALVTARRRALAADVVLGNHALLFADRAVGGALLGHYDVLVVDEAHHLEDVATDFFTVSFGRRTIRGGPHSLWTADLDGAGDGVRAAGMSGGGDTGAGVAAAWHALQSAVAAGQDATDRFFRAIAGRLPDVASDRVPYAVGSPLFYDAGADVNAAGDALRTIATAAGALGEAAPAPGEGVPDYAGTFQVLGAQALETASALEFLAAGADEDYVFFVRVGPDGPVSLSAAPVDVGPRLGTFIEDAGSAAVLTSATLAVGDTFDYTVRRFGLDARRTRSKCYESPFDLENNRTVHVAGWLPAPGEPAFAGAAAAVIDGVQRVLGRRHLVLATSRAQAAAVSACLRAASSAGRPVFSQTDGGSRADLLDRFRVSPGATLVGLASFWEGVDLPGVDLEIVTVLKLPFRVPDDPVVRARSERLRAYGENPFEVFFVPDAVLRLRQGIGRLIRTGRDRGAVILLDRRVAHSSYGPFVVNAAAGGCTVNNSQGELIDGLASFFGDGAV